MRSVIPPAHGGWTVEEEQELDRIRALCRRYRQIAVECGHTDEDDPWCIVYHKERQRIILHIARLNRWYVMAWQTQSRWELTRSITNAVEFAVRGLDWEIAVQANGLS